MAERFCTSCVQYHPIAEFRLRRRGGTARMSQCRQCHNLAENIRQILVQEQEHQIELATALGEDVPDVTTPAQRA